MYQQVANVLRDRIAYGIYPKDELLPPEMLLLSEFNVSRHTIREAMRMLVSEGLIERSPGRGTIVSPPSRTRGNWGIKSLNDLIGEFEESQIVVLKRASRTARRFPQIADILGTDRKSSMFLVQRIISVDDGPIALHTVFTHTKYSSRIPRQKIGQQAMIGLIEEHCRVQASRTRQIATAVTADAQTAKLLGVRVGSPMLLLKRIYTSSDDEPIQYSELLCRPDRYYHTVDFHRTDGAASNGAGAKDNRSKKPAGVPPVRSQARATRVIGAKLVPARTQSVKALSAEKLSTKTPPAKTSSAKKPSGKTPRAAARARARSPTTPS